MDWREALEAVIARTRHEDYRRLCGDDHPDRELWRARMIAKVDGKPLPEYPPIYVQAANLAGAVVRVAAAALHGEPVRVPHEEYMHRLDICLRCEFNAIGPYAVHCSKCGCSGAKLTLATEECPDHRWARWEGPPAPPPSP